MFRFYEELNDFLPSEKRKCDFSYAFTGKPSVKDAIQALGVPHTEVDLILIDHVSVPFTAHIHDGMHISVYPVFELLDISPVIRLRPKPLRISRFICDVHLGSLARFLRMLGFDTLYRNDLDDEEIVKIAASEKRIILTRDHGILFRNSVTHGYYVRTTDPQDQEEEILLRFDLFTQFTPLTRCISCNTPLESIDKEKIISRLQPETARSFQQFHHCPFCDKIYWKGSHYERMIQRIARLRDTR